jgi:hypothetical protein
VRRVTRRGNRLFEVDDPADLPAMLLWWVNRVMCFETLDHVMVHAGVVATADGRAVVLPAPQESGKTTLTAGLVRRGLRYLSDEAAALDPATGQVDPYPKALSIEEGSWAVLADLRPDLPSDLERFAARQWHVDPRWIRPDAIHEGPAAPDLIILPRYEAGAATTLEPISPAEAVAAMAEEAFVLGHHGQAGLEALGRLATSSRCYRLLNGDLDEAVDAVLSVV